MVEVRATVYLRSGEAIRVAMTATVDLARSRAILNCVDPVSSMSISKPR